MNIYLHCVFSLTVRSKKMCSIKNRCKKEEQGGECEFQRVNLS